jgi:hypothetical protein
MNGVRIRRVAEKQRVLCTKRLASFEATFFNAETPAQDKPTSAE